MFPDRQHDFVLSVSESDIVVIKEMTPDETSEEVCALAESIEGACTPSCTCRRSSASAPRPTICASWPTAIRRRRSPSRSARCSIRKPVIHYDNLGIGRIIYQLPTTLCEMFLSEASRKTPLRRSTRHAARSIASLRTTSTFRRRRASCMSTGTRWSIGLEKVKKITGLDLREFEDAITLQGRRDGQEVSDERNRRISTYTEKSALWGALLRDAAETSFFRNFWGGRTV